ncbi:hypothetical protein C8F01DRAFT_656628 [Mycena amicta]|nr:hypothetical protein C8F01DRAFT_656628 [Mycena amicta]
MASEANLLWVVKLYRDLLSTNFRSGGYCFQDIIPHDFIAKRGKRGQRKSRHDQTAFIAPHRIFIVRMPARTVLPRRPRTEGRSFRLILDLVRPALCARESYLAHHKASLASRNPDVVKYYSENVVDTPHKKNLLLLQVAKITTRRLSTSQAEEYLLPTIHLQDDCPGPFHGFYFPALSWMYLSLFGTFLAASCQKFWHSSW